MNRRSFLAGLAASPLLASGWRKKPPANFMARLKDMMDVAPVPGCAAGRIENSRVTWAGSAGVAEDAVFEAASLTKQITAYAAFLLHDQGKLDFEKPLQQYVEMFEDPKARTVTARQVLSHSSGFPNWRFNATAKLVPGFEPGSAFQYSGEGYVCLQRVMEAVSGVPFGRLVEQTVFKPLGMTSSAMVKLPEMETRLVQGHDRRGKPQTGSKERTRKAWDLAVKWNKPQLDWRYADMEAAQKEMGNPLLPNWMTPNAAASLCTTGGDYAKFLVAAMKRREYGQEQVKIRGPLSWGLGFGIEKAAGREYLWQWGDNPGFKNIVLADAAHGTAVFVFTNGDSGMHICERVATQATGHDHPAFLWI